MAEIALNLVLNGVPVAITSITELETAINTARGELSKLSINSEEFKKLSNEIKTADTRLKGLKEQSQGISFEKQIGSIVKVGSAVASSFAAAKAAVGLFGGESEKVNEAAVKAQQGLTVVFALREAAEGAVALKTAAATIATNANTIATNASNVATKALFTTLAANPYGALLAVIGLVVAAVYLLIDAESEEEKQAKRSKEAQQEYSKSIKTAGISAALTANQIGFLNEQLDNNIIVFEKYEAAARALVPSLQNINLSTKEGRLLFEQYTAALASVSFYTDQIKTIEGQFTKAREESNAKEQIRIRGLINSLVLQRSAYQLTVKEIEKINEDAGKAIQDQEEKLRKIDEDRKRRLQEELSARLQLLRTTLDQQRATLLLLNQTSKFVDSEAKIVSLLKERNNQQITLKKLLDQNIPFTQKLTAAQKLYNDTLEKTSDEVDKAKKGFDDLNNVFDSQIDKIEKTGPFEDLTEIFALMNEQATNFKTAFKDTLNEDALKNVDVALENTKKIVKIFNDLKKIPIDFNFDSLKKSIEEYNKVLSNPLSDDKEREKAVNDLEEERKKFVNQYELLLKSSTSYQDALKLEGEARTKSLELLDIENKKTAESIFELTKNNIENFNQFKKGVEDTKNEVDEFNQKVKDLAGVELRDFLLKNKDLLVENYSFDIKIVEDDYKQLLLLQDEIADQRYDKEEKFLTKVNNLTKQLKAQGVNIEELTYQEKLNLLEGFYSKAVDTTKDGEKKLQDEEIKKFERFKAQLAEIQGFLNSLAQTSQQAFDLQFSILEKRYQRTLTNIVGDTERANELRIQAEEDYQKKKTKLEKQAAKIQLSISLAQAIANTAEAITKVYSVYAASGPLAAVFAGLTAGLSAVQVGIIAAQISAIDKYQQGGRIRKGQGGMVVGPSHEFGGVNFSNGIQLEGNESVINRVSTLQYSDLLSQINMAGGGRPIVMNNFDDSRIVEALAKQKQTPLRAFVVESDITNKQNLTKRLEQLSQL